MNSYARLPIGNTAFDAYEHVFPVFPALVRLKSALLGLKSALLRLISALANNTLLIILAIMNTFFPFFPALVRLISALLGLISALLRLISALLRLINALLGIECADRYKLPPAYLFWRLQAHSWDNTTAAVLAAGPGNKPLKN
jgi:hypothetical protein